MTFARVWCRLLAKEAKLRYFDQKLSRSQKSAMVHLPVPLILGRRGATRNDIPDVLQSTTSSPLSSSVVQVGTLPQFLDQWRSSTFNRLVLNMMKGHHLQLRCHTLFSIISNGAKLRLLWFIIPFSKRQWMSHYPGVPLKHSLVVLASTQMYFCF